METHTRYTALGPVCESVYYYSAYCLLLVDWIHYSWLCLMWSVDPFVWINYGGLEVRSLCHVCCMQRWDLHNFCVIIRIALKVVYAAEFL